MFPLRMSPGSRAALLLLVLTAASASAADPGQAPRVVFRGNVLFDELVYRAVLDLPADVPATRAQAAAIATKLRSFLRRAGYDLATVRAQVQGTQIAVQIDEGRLDKIVVIGQGLLETFRVKLELSMPQDVFNRPLLERQLRVFAARYRLDHYSYQLVPVSVPANGSPLEDAEPPVGIPPVRPGQRYELHLLLTSSPWARGFSPEISLDSPEGLGLGGQYRGQDALTLNDRWEVRGRVAGSLQRHLDSEESRPVLTRAFGQARWFTPPLWTDAFRPSLTFRADYLSLQRPDLRLDSFDQATFGASAEASVFGRGATLTLGMGVERRFLFALVKASGANPRIDEAPRAQTRPYGEALIQLVLNPGELRTDRRHVLNVAARAYVGSPSSRDALWLRTGYRHRFAFGWHELWWRSRGTLLSGEVPFPDEESLGTHLRAFAGSDYARKVASGGLEFRYSLLRDVLKIGLFYQQAVFGAIDRATDRESLGFAGAGGPGLHVLLADQFQLDAYFAVGWSPGGTVGYAGSLALRQVY
jgi:hypothetical protein